MLGRIHLPTKNEFPDACQAAKAAYSHKSEKLRYAIDTESKPRRRVKAKMQLHA